MLLCSVELFCYDISLCLFLFSDVPVAFACAVLVCLFMLQHYGTRKIGFIFAPIVTIWILFIGGVGLYNIFHWNPKILGAISPVFMFKFVRNIDKKSWKSLGSILLCVAGQLTRTKVLVAFHIGIL